jgi:radical SAM superfamily enzyme YgiQ (UPF0313 family)
MKVVLVRPPFYALFGLATPKMKTYPLNLLYLATYVRDRSRYGAGLVDGENLSVPGLFPRHDNDADPEDLIHRGIPTMIELLGDPEHPLWLDLEQHILKQNPDLVGITCNSGNMDTVRIIVGRIKRHGLPVILGGAHPTVLPEQSINYTEADMAAIGEGEITLVQAMDHLSGKAPTSQVLSLAHRKKSSVSLTPPRDLIDPIDELPIPDRGFIDREDYFGEVIMTGRGCPFNCSYCASRNIWGRRVRLRSVSSIIDELHILARGSEAHEAGPGKRSALADREGRRVVKIVDDTFTLNKKRTMNLLEEIIAQGLSHFEFTGGVRADTLDEALVKKMREANFRRVTLGVESGSPRILKMIRKGQTNEDVKRALRLLRDQGIHSHTFFMIGFPEETPEDIELSKKLIMEARPDHVEINMVTPYPGTELFKQLIPEDPSRIDRWYRWFHQGLSTHSNRLGYDLDRAYEGFLEFARKYHASSKVQADQEPASIPGSS